MILCWFSRLFSVAIVCLRISREGIEWYGKNEKVKVVGFSCACGRFSLLSRVPVCSIFIWHWSVEWINLNGESEREYGMPRAKVPYPHQSRLRHFYMCHFDWPNHHRPTIFELFLSLPLPTIELGLKSFVENYSNSLKGHFKLLEAEISNKIITRIWM